MASFADGFDRLYALRPHEIQLGILKRLRGTPIARHNVVHGMVYDRDPPYTVLQTSVVSALEMQRFTRLARYWDLFANSGRFKASLSMLLALHVPENLLHTSMFAQSTSPFYAFLDFSEWLWQTTRKTSGLTPERLLDHLFDYLTKIHQTDPHTARKVLLADYLQSGARANPASLQALLRKRCAPLDGSTPALVARQGRHACA